MIKVIIARHDEALYNNYVGPTIRRQQCAICDVYDRPELGKPTIADKYNYGITTFVQKGQLNPQDVVVFVHEDVRIIDPQFAHKLEIVFAQKQEVGIVGVCGTTEITERGGWHLTDQNNLRGHLMQEFQGTVNHNIYGNRIGYYDDLCAVDGFCFAIRAKLFTEGVMFDKNVGEWDFYDLDVCLQARDKGYKVAVADILLQHKSEGRGMLGDGWKKSLPKFIKKWSDKGYKFPITTNNFKLRDFSKDENNIAQTTDSPIEIEV